MSGEKTMLLYADDPHPFMQTKHNTLKRVGALYYIFIG